MSTAPEPARDLVPADHNLPSSVRNQLPGIVARAGNAAVFAADEFFFGRIRNQHTRRAYFIAVRRFLAAMEDRGLELTQITPRDVGQYLDRLRKTEYERGDPQAAPGSAAALFRWHGHPARDHSEPGTFRSRRAQ